VPERRPVLFHTIATALVHLPIKPCGRHTNYVMALFPLCRSDFTEPGREPTVRVEEIRTALLVQKPGWNQQRSDVEPTANYRSNNGAGAIFPFMCMVMRNALLYNIRALHTADYKTGPTPRFHRSKHQNTTRFKRIKTSSFTSTSGEQSVTTCSTAHAKFRSLLCMSFVT
jgi:hypothetical protein